MKKRFPPFYQRIVSSFSLGPADTFVYYNVLAFSKEVKPVSHSEPSNLTLAPSERNWRPVLLCVLHGAG